MLFDSFMLFLTERDHESVFSPNTDPNKIRISSIPYCNRKAFFSKIGHENFSSNYLLRTASEGRLHHLDTQIAASEFVKINKEWTVVNEEDIEFTFPDGTSIRGKIDMLFVKNDGTVIIVDIKAVASKGWYNSREYGAYQSHQDQVLIYIFCLKEREKNIVGERKYIGELWYKNRNDGQWHKQPVLYDEDRVEFLLEKVKNLISALKERVPPDEYSPMYPYECQSKSGRCPYHSLCYENGEFRKFRTSKEEKEVEK